jgi:hypothetical protein
MTLLPQIKVYGPYQSSIHCTHRVLLLHSHFRSLNRCLCAYSTCLTFLITVVWGHDFFGRIMFWTQGFELAWGITSVHFALVILVMGSHKQFFQVILISGSKWLGLQAWVTAVWLLVIQNLEIKYPICFSLLELSLEDTVKFHMNIQISLPILPIGKRWVYNALYNTANLKLLVF